MLADAYKPVVTASDLDGLPGDCLALHPRFLEHFLGRKHTFLVHDSFLTYFDWEQEEWEPAPFGEPFGLPKDEAYIRKLAPYTSFQSPDPELGEGFYRWKGLYMEHRLSVPFLDHLRDKLRKKRLKPLIKYYDACREELSIRHNDFDFSRWDDCLEWSHKAFGKDSWLWGYDKGFLSFYRKSPNADVLSFRVKDRFIGAVFAGHVDGQFEMITHVCDPELPQFSKFMLMAALVHGIDAHGSVYTLPDSFESEELMEKSWKTLWKLDTRRLYGYTHDWHEHDPEFPPGTESSLADDEEWVYDDEDDEEDDEDDDD